MILRALLFLLATALPVRADVAEAVQGQVLPGYAAFAAQARGLADAAARSCEAETLRVAWNGTFDAWLAVVHLRFGPVEEDGRALAIAFWPDPKGLGQKTVASLLAPGAPDLSDPAEVAELSVAGRGLFALERLLYVEVPGDRTCAVTRALTADLARMAEEIRADWAGGYAAALLTAGRDGNLDYLSPQEARQALFTQLVTGLEFVADQRLGRPLGTFDRPRPERAEARFSGRSVRNVRLSMEALAALAVDLVPDSPQTQAAFARAATLAAALPEDALSRVQDPQVWLKVQILQQAVHTARDAAQAEIGPALDVGVGFNAADGD